jgi:hypothetical protein
MPEEKDQPSGFKVVDKRVFSTDGTRREEPTEEKPAESRPRRPLAPAAPEELEAEDYSEIGPTGFDTLVSYLSTTAMFQLGLLPGPGGERIPADLVNARRTIDLLEILQQKTRGNLTQGEARLLEDVLYELRLSYVEIEKRLAPRPR